MHVVSQDQQVCRASYVTTSYNRIRTFLVGCEKSRCHVCRVSVCFGFFLLADANNATPTVLCVSTCSDGLLDFHMVAELV